MNFISKRFNIKNNPQKYTPPINKTDVIIAKSISKNFLINKQVTTIVKEIDLVIKEGEFVVILGPSGSGKTTLLNMLSGLFTPDAGTLNILGYNLEKLNSKDLTIFRRENISYIFQQYGLLPNLTVRENVEIGSFLYKKNKKVLIREFKQKIKLVNINYDLKIKLAKENSKTIKSLNNQRNNELLEVNTKFKSNKNDTNDYKFLSIDNVLKSLDIDKLIKKFPSELSGGQQQRVSIARSIAKKPNILFADEPTGAVDSEMSKIILQCFLDLNQFYNVTVILVTHNRLISEIATKVIEFNDGIIVKTIINKKPKKINEIKWGKNEEE